MTPNDPLFPLQWYLKNTGQAGGTAGIDIKVEKVWNDYSGADVTVGVYDDGVETEGPNAHPDLVANYDPALQPLINGVPVNGQPVNNAPGSAGDSHGTAVAGIIVASANNGLGVAGIAFGAKFGTVKFLSNASIPSADMLTTLANFDVTNHSWGGGAFEGPFNADPIPGLFETAAGSGRAGFGTIILKAAGNDRFSGQEGQYVIFRDANDEPANVSRHAVAVGAILNTGFVANYSTPGANLLVSAPAGPSDSTVTGFNQDITTDRVGYLGYNPGSSPVPLGQVDYAAFNGTSAATPVVSGVVALMLQANPQLGWRDVQTILAYSARHVGSAIDAPPVGNELNTWKFNHAVDWNGGGLHFSRDYGFGLVDALAAVRLAETWNVGSPLAQTSFNEQSATDTKAPGSTIAPGATETVTFTISDAIRLEDVYLTLNLDFLDVSKLAITLTSPRGTVSEIWRAGGYPVVPPMSPTSLPEPWSFASREFFGESANANTGTWTLAITNNGTTPSGTFTNATLTAYGATGTGGHTYVYTDEFGAFGALPGRDTLAGSSGDTLNAAAVTSDSRIDLVPGTSDTSIAGKAVTMGAGLITNAIGGDGNDTIVGNTADNGLYGGRGNDLLDGHPGADNMYGGAGNDLYIVDNPADAVFEKPAQGVDEVAASTHFRLSTDVENLTLQGSDPLQGYGNDEANLLNGNPGNNLLVGNGGADLLDGKAGIDLMVGGLGDDVFFADETSDFCSELPDQGIDSVFASTNYRLAANLENLVLQGNANLQGYGNELANALTSNTPSSLPSGDPDFLTGIDLLAGGADDDTYFVQNPNSAVIENPNEGNDTVFSTVDFRLPDNVENLTLLGGNNLQGYGNAESNTLVGNSGVNLLDGGGGADMLTGNVGNDLFLFRVGEANGDTVVDFSRTGPLARDSLMFVGYGAGATFTNINATQWQVNYNGDLAHEIVTFANGAVIDSSDYIFV
jgi:subtilisin family serine protease